MITAAALLLASMLHAGPEREVSPPAPGHIQFHAAVTRAGDTTLTAWVDARWDFTSVTARVNDGAPFVVATQNQARWVRVATDGTDFVVLWSASDPDLKVFARRVLHDGTMPGPAVEVTHQGFNVGPSCVTWNGEVYLTGFVKVVEWNPRGTTRTEVWGRRLTREGAVSGDEFRIADGGVNGVACASTAQTTLFVWGYRFVEGATLTRGGTISGKFPLFSGEAAVVASNGTNFLAAAYDRFTAAPADLIQRATVSELGTVVQKLPLDVPAVPYGLESPAVGARPNGGYLLVYGTEQLLALPLNGEGNFEGDGLPIVLARKGAMAAVTPGLVVYQRETANFTDPRWRLFARQVFDGGLARRRSVRR